MYGTGGRPKGTTPCCKGTTPCCCCSRVESSPQFGAKAGIIAGAPIIEPAAPAAPAAPETAPAPPTGVPASILITFLITPAAEAASAIMAKLWSVEGEAGKLIGGRRGERPGTVRFRHARGGGQRRDPRGKTRDSLGNLGKNPVPEKAIKRLVRVVRDASNVLCANNERGNSTQV